jgi:hypothetical protein
MVLNGKLMNHLKFISNRSNLLKYMNYKQQTTSNNTMLTQNDLI